MRHVAGCSVGDHEVAVTRAERIAALLEAERLLIAADFPDTAWIVTSKREWLEDDVRRYPHRSEDES